MESSRGGPAFQGYPAAIATYIATEKARDLDAQMALFTEHAFVHDEGRDYHGLDAVRGWKRDAWGRFDYRIEPLNISRDGEVIRLEVRLEGNFPGSSVELSCSFGMSGERIASLVIS
jgi:hypothetical protein